MGKEAFPSGFMLQHRFANDAKLGCFIVAKDDMKVKGIDEYGRK